MTATRQSVNLSLPSNRYPFSRVIIFLPVHASTPGIDRLVDDFKKKGSNPAHSLHIISTRDDEDLAFSIGDALSEHFHDVSTQALAVPDKNLIKLANAMFFAAVKAYRGHKPAEDQVADQPMIYLDSTYRPTEKLVFDRLQSEFFLKGSPSVMARTETTGTGTAFKRVTVGPVILGRKFLESTILIDHLDDKTHWRERMCHELAEHCTETRQIGRGQQSLLKQGNFVKTPS